MTTKRAQPVFDVAERRKAILQMALDGLDAVDIAEFAGISVALARAEVRRLLKDIPSDKAKRLQKVEGLRLERRTRSLVRIQGVAQKLEKSKKPAIKLAALKEQRECDLALVKVSESKRKLFGLDCPTKFAETDPSGENSAPSADARALLLSRIADLAAAAAKGEGGSGS